MSVLYCRGIKRKIIDELQTEREREGGGERELLERCFAVLENNPTIAPTTTTTTTLSDRERALASKLICFDEVLLRFTVDHYPHKV